MASAVDLSELENDPRLFLYTSLTAGSSHIITATSRLETILKANKIPFQAIDTATDEKARKLWGRRAGKKKLPGLVKEGYVIADMDEVEEWNEFGELKENIGPVLAAGSSQASAPPAAAAPAAASSTANAGATDGTVEQNSGMRAAAAQAASIGAARKGPPALVDRSKIRPLPGAAESEDGSTNTETTDIQAASAVTADGSKDTEGEGSRSEEVASPPPPDDSIVKTTEIHADSSPVEGTLAPEDLAPSMTITSGSAEAASTSLRPKEGDDGPQEAEEATQPEKVTVESSTAGPEEKSVQAVESNQVPVIDEPTPADNAPDTGALGTSANEAALVSTDSLPRPDSASSNSGGVGAPIGERRHRGSSISLASADEIQQIENQNSIPEDAEEEEAEEARDQADQAQRKTDRDAASASAKSSSASHGVEGSTAEFSGGTSAAAERVEGKQSSAVESGAQDAKEGDNAGVSVED